MTNTYMANRTTKSQVPLAAQHAHAQRGMHGALLRFAILIVSCVGSACLYGAGIMLLLGVDPNSYNLAPIAIIGAVLGSIIASLL